VVPIAATIALATAAGVFTERRMASSADRLGQRLAWVILWILLPPVAFFNIAALQLTAEVGAGIAFGYVAILVPMGLAYLVGRHLLRLPSTGVGALMLVAALGNTGYLGLPFSAALFGTDELPNAVAYDILVSTLALLTAGFSVGAAFGTVAGGEFGTDAESPVSVSPRDRVVAFFSRNPALWACAAGFLAPRALAPDWAVDISQGVVFAILPLGFFVVGITLATHGSGRFAAKLSRPVGWALGLKLLVAPAILLALAAAVHEVPESYPVQAGMASAINSIIVAGEYGLDRGLVAAAIAWSTAIVVTAGLAIALL